MTLINKKTYKYKGLPSNIMLQWEELTTKNAVLHNYTSPFYRPEFAKALDQVHNNIMVDVISQQEELYILPYQYEKTIDKSIGLATRLGEELCDYFAPIGNQHKQLDWIFKQSSLNFLSYSHYASLGNSVAHKHSESISSQIVIADGSINYFNWLESVNNKFYKDTLRRERKLIKDHGEVSYHYHKNDSQVLKKLIEHKRAQYNNTGVQDALIKPWKRNLLMKLLTDYGDHNSDFKCVLSTLELKDDWLAYHIGIQCNGTLQYWFPVYNPKYRKYGPGRLLLFNTIREAEKYNIDTIDRGEGFSDAKKETANYLSTMAKGVMIKPTIFGLFSNILSSLSWRIKRSKNT